MTTLTTEHFKYIADSKLFCCGIDSLSARVTDDILIGDCLTLVNPKTRNRRKFKYKFQMKDRWVYTSGSLTLYIYKGEKYQGVPSPGIVVPPIEQPPINLVSSLPDGYPLMFEL